MSSSKEERALEEKGITVGDTVRTRYRGGVREGVVKEVATSTEQTPHPPKVIFDRERPGQAPKEVAHNPSTLEKGALRSWGPAERRRAHAGCFFS